MSPNGLPGDAGAGGAGGGRGFTPSRPEKFSIDAIRQFVALFKELLNEHPVIRWSIIAAGVAGVFDVLHTVWLALRFIFRF